ncbi:hypothetical protein TWF694_006723 [Orbilia ellipsospora]|uniref:Calcineurin-like phosphoesterase domain-containing protein n=1 Tax=Orbilia ellipsospora TaxID=2528407 RepID=A0AAV9XMM0_9PEZI
MPPPLLYLLSTLVKLLTIISILSTTALYLYPLLLRCSYPNPTAPFRLLTLADPQLEGNTAIFHRRYTKSPAWLRELRRFRKTLDLWGNDYYLAHIYRTLHTTIPALTTLFPFLPQGVVPPTHVVVLGDLIGSQWIKDPEFNIRGKRYWNTVFANAKRLPEPAVNEQRRIPASIYPMVPWPDTLINVAGNHDIGYSGDIRPDLIQRFEETYGPVNYAFEIPFPAVNRTVLIDGVVTNMTVEPKLRVINLNSLNIDSPARELKIQLETYDFMNTLFAEDMAWDGSVGTVLLTHVPLHKPAGVCVDPPMEKYYDAMYGSLLREQNHISKGASEMLLGELFGVKRLQEEERLKGKEMGIVLTGHDHEGCDVLHWRGDVEVEDKNDNPEGEGEEVVKRMERRWKSGKWEERAGDETVWIREVTVRSMMGEFGGNAGLTSAWFDVESMSWRFEYSTCPVGTQHIWWTVHIVDFITLVGAVLYGVILLVMNSQKGKKVDLSEKKVQ